VALDSVTRPPETAAEPPTARGVGAGARLRRVGVYLVIAALSLFCVVPFGWVLLASVDARAGLYAQLPELSATTSCGSSRTRRHRGCCSTAS
jgi:ABC-type glycerol-3-phosphate transport system permease component